MSANGGRYCLNTSSIRNCGLSLKKKIELSASVGYDAIELWVDELETYLDGDGTLSQLREVLDQNNITVANIIAFFEWAVPETEAREKGLQDALYLFEIAQAIHCPHVAASPSGLTHRTDVPLDAIARYYHDLLEMTESTNATPLLEFWSHSKTLGSLRDTMEVLRLVDNPRALLLADVFHMAKAKGSWESLCELDGTSIGLFHVNDYPQATDIRQLTDDQRLYPGDGVAPLTEIRNTLEKIGYRGIYSIELFNEKYEEAGALDVAQSGLAKMKQLLG